MEGNDEGSHYTDSIHGTHFFTTLYRNYFSGQINNGTQNEANAFTLNGHARFFNAVGNVSSDPTRWSLYETQTLDTNQHIYNLGFKGNCSACGAMSNDARVKITMLRWGNWDDVTSTSSSTVGDQTGTRWCGNSLNTGWVSRCASTSEVPTSPTVTNYANTVPSTETLPSSLYLSAKPSWFGSNTYPPIGPDVTNSGSPIASTGGHVYKIPARVCYESLSNDGANNYKVFNAGTCYP
jgi:hypothetical protein